MAQFPRPKPKPAPKPHQSIVGKIIQLGPLTASCINLINTYLAQNNPSLPTITPKEWLLPSFLVTIGTAAWAAYSRGFSTRLEEILEKRGANHVDWLFQRTDRLFQQFWWHWSGFDEKYIKYQADRCIPYRVEGYQHPEGISNPMLQHVFVPLDVVRYREDAYTTRIVSANLPETSASKQSIWQVISDVHRRPDCQLISILAAVGYGKTTLLKSITLSYAKKIRRDQDYKTPNLIPVLIYLRDLKDDWKTHSESNLESLIQNYHLPRIIKDDRIKYPPSWVKNNLLKGCFIIMLDGFDEVPRQNRNSVSQWINKQIENYPKTVFILTSRHEGYQDYQVSEHVETRLYIKYFDRTQRQSFLNKWYLYQIRSEYYQNKQISQRDIQATTLEKVDNLIRQIEEQERLRLMSANPLLLTMMATLHYRNSEKPLPLNRAELYQKIIDLQLEDRPAQRRIKMLAPKEASQLILQKIAVYMMSSSTQGIKTAFPLNKKSKATIRHWFSQNHVLVQESQVDQWIKQMVDVSQILSEKEENIYEFSHLSFQEYLAAAEVNRRGQESLLLQHSGDKEWHETIMLYAAQKHSFEQRRQIIRYLYAANTRDSVKLARDCLVEFEIKLSSREEEKLQQITKKLRLLNYEKLEDHLIREEWKEADLETYEIMNKALDNPDEVALDSSSFSDFADIDIESLKTLDWLWQKYSAGRFGFSVQQDIFLKIGGETGRSPRKLTINNLGNTLKWKVNDEWINSYNKMNFNFNLRTIESVPKGYLPLGIVSRAKQNVYPDTKIPWSAIIDRIVAFSFYEDLF